MSENSLIVEAFVMKCVCKINFVFFSLEQDCEKQEAINQSPIFTSHLANKS